MTFLTNNTRALVTAGASYSDASRKALGLLGRLMTQQAATLAFLDCFRLLGYAALCGIPLAMLIKKFRVGGSTAAH